MRGLALASYHASLVNGRLHLRVRARELRVEAHIESRVEIDRARATAQQAVEVGAAQGEARRRWLECAVREVVHGEVECLEGEHCVVHETVEMGWSAASRRARKSVGTLQRAKLRGEDATMGQCESVGEGAVSNGGERSMRAQGGGRAGAGHTTPTRRCRGHPILSQR